MNPQADRALRSLFVALSVGLAWGIRGDFGGVDGAMYPGAILGLGLAYVSGDDGLFRRMAWLGLLGLLFISIGGMIPYGVLHGYAKSDTLVNFGYGYLALLLDGGLWGLFGGAAIALVLEDERPPWWECLLVVVAVVLGGLVFQSLLSGLGVKVNPPPPGIKDRGEALLGFIGGGIVLVSWLWYRGFYTGLRGAFFGFVGFGVGMFFGRFLGNVSIHLPGDINHWNVGEVSAGFFGGLIYTWGMLPHAKADHDDTATISWRTVLCMVLVMVFMPLNHLKGEPASKSLPEYTAKLTEWGSSDAAALASQIHQWLSIVAFAGLIIVPVWAWLHMRNEKRFAWFPVMALSLTMLLFQNLNALYFWAPPRPDYINMHNVFWGMFLLMVLYVAVRRGHEALALDEGRAAVVYPAWAGAVVLLFVATLAMSLFVNGEESMRSANTRWPLWSHELGVPFPGRE